MKGINKNKILAYIKQKGVVAPKELKKILDIKERAIFHQLHNLLKEGIIIKTGTVPKIFYSLKPMVIAKGWEWVKERQPAPLPEENYCYSRDVFQVRVEHLLADLTRTTNDANRSALISAVVGEIGNNSFDHNLGNWKDVPGIYFATDLQHRTIVLADRGQGVLATLKKVRPELKDPISALQVAFTEYITGRAPEQRGNGLKFVRKIIESHQLELEYYSGNAICAISQGKMEINISRESIEGTLAIIKF